MSQERNPFRFRSFTTTEQSRKPDILIYGSTVLFYNKFKNSADVIIAGFFTAEASA